jgi:hypothetical protein
VAEALERAAAQLETIILGKRQQVRLALCCILARGHLLIEDIPGVGKTTLALALGQVLGLALTRIQFTSDLLPADIVGVSVWDRDHARFTFQPGPVFSHLVLADEINRATPKTQSALLEAMEERRVSVDGQTRPLPDPFVVIATQNPEHQIGTFPTASSCVSKWAIRIAPPNATCSAVAIAATSSASWNPWCPAMAWPRCNAGSIRSMWPIPCGNTSWTSSAPAGPPDPGAWACLPVLPWPCNGPAGPGPCSMGAIW